MPLYTFLALCAVVGLMAGGASSGMAEFSMHMSVLAAAAGTVYLYAVISSGGGAARYVAAILLAMATWSYFAPPEIVSDAAVAVITDVALIFFALSGVCCRSK